MNWEEIKQKAETMMMDWDPDPDHAQQVCHLALMLYKELESLHQLSSLTSADLKPDQTLELAALLHDIGWTAPGNRGHHKKSQDRIMNTEIPGLSVLDKILVAQVARYHRKRHPDPMLHFQFAEMNHDEQMRVQWLAAILRIADGLDRSHTADVDHLNCDICTDDITINIYCSTGSSTAIYGANRKKMLLEKISDKAVIILHDGSFSGINV